MKKKKWNKLVSVLLVMVTVMSLLSGCGRKSTEKEDAETITVYLWTTNLYEKYASYIQEQLPDINIEFVVGNNDLDFYRFLNENGGLPDIITCCRFSLHDASPLKDSLMDLSTTNAAGAVYDTYLSSFMNEDGSVNWLPWTDAIGVPPTVPRITQNEKVWTVSSGRGLLNVGSSSSGIQD